jgi:hypothetical protein
MLPNDAILEIPFLAAEECRLLIDYAKAKREELLRKSDTSELDTSLVSLNQPTTIFYGTYCVLKDFPHIGDRLADNLRVALPNLAWPLLVQAWVNTYAKGEGIKWHNHAGMKHHSYTANVFLGGEANPGLTIRLVDGSLRNFPNKPGTLILMNCDSFHTVTPNKFDEIRYTMGLTIHDYHAIDPVGLSTAALNSTSGSVILRA